LLPGQKNDSKVVRMWQEADAEEVSSTYEAEHKWGEERFTS